MPYVPIIKLYGEVISGGSDVPAFVGSEGDVTVRV